MNRLLIRPSNDAANGSAIYEAAQRPIMRFVAVKSEEKQASGMVFKICDLLIRQRVKTINALRDHLPKFGIIAPQGPAHIGRFAAKVDASEGCLPDPVRVFCRTLLDGIKALTDRIAELNTEVRGRASHDEMARRLMTIPGIDPVCATALETLTAPVDISSLGVTSPRGWD